MSQATEWDSQTFLELTEYREVEEVLRRGREFVLEGTKAESDEFVHGTLIALDGRPHLNRRRALMRMINPRQPWGAEGTLIDEVLAHNLARIESTVRPKDGAYHFDLVTFARQIIWRFTAAFVGIDGIEDDDAVARFVELATPVVAGLSIEYHPPHRRPELLATTREARAAIREEVFNPSLARRKAALAAGEELPADLLTSLLRSDSGDSDDMIFNEAIQLLAAAVNNPVLQLTWALDDVLRWLEEHPDDRARIGEKSFLNAAVAETLRLHRSSRPYLVRITVADTTLESTGRFIPAGTWIAGYLMAADHDTSVFGDDADVYNLDREPVDPKTAHFGLAFGAGPHLCIGRPMLVWEQGSEDHQGIQTKLLRALLARDARPDPAGVQKLESEPWSHRYTRYDVIMPVRAKG
jgi:cytochrome P450